MSVTLQRPWTVEEFFRWAGTQDGRYEFDGTGPVAMTGGNARHSRVTTNIHAALHARLRGSAWRFYGPDLGLQAAGSKIRYPDALVTEAVFPDTSYMAPDVRIVFEVVSPSSGQIDRIEKVREYQAVGSILRYVIVETRAPGLLVFHRQDGADAWTAGALTLDEGLDLPELGISIPVAEFYEDVDFAKPGAA